MEIFLMLNVLQMLTHLRRAWNSTASGWTIATTRVNVVVISPLFVSDDTTYSCHLSYWIHRPIKVLT